VARHLILLVGLAALVASCGGGHKASMRLTAKAFRAQADAVCAETQTHQGRLAGLRKLHPPLSYADLYARWLKAEREAIEAARPPKHPPVDPLLDPYVGVTIAEGKISGYARRLGATGCE
jgi:hypothetical protein